MSSEFDAKRMNSAIETGASRGIDEIAMLLEDDMRMYAPIKTGALKRSIETDKINDLSTIVGSDIYYAHYVDKYYENKGISYVDRTFESNEDLVADIIIDEILKSIDEI